MEALVTKDGALGALATASVVWAGCPGSAVKLVKMPQMLSPLIQTLAHILLRTELSPQRGGQAEHLSAFFKSSALQLKCNKTVSFSSFRRTFSDEEQEDKVIFFTINFHATVQLLLGMFLWLLPTADHTGVFIVFCHSYQSQISNEY